MAKIFVSYARDDARKVKNVLTELHAQGFEFWQDISSIGNGKYWPEQIAQAIMSCSRFLLFMSAASMKSDNVRDEVQVAYEEKKKRIILRLDDSKLPARLRIQLTGIQRTDYSSPTWEAEIISALGNNKTNPPKPAPHPVSKPIRPIKSPPEKPREVKIVVEDLEHTFSANRTYYRDECGAAISELEKLESIAGVHWINPVLVFRESVSRQYLLDKIEVICNLIYDFQETCPPGSPAQRQAIHNELKALLTELSRKTK